MIWENIKIALSSMVHNKMRTLLSLLGIIIGVASVVAILNLGQSVTDSITESMNVAGIDMVNIFPSGSSRELNVFDETFGDTLMANVDGIQAVLPVASSSTRVRSGQEIRNVTINGVTSDFFEVNSAELLYGDYFSALDNINRRQVVVLGKDIAEELFPGGGAVGSYISIFRQSSKRYQVVGVLDEKDATLGTSFNSSIFIPLNTYGQRFRRIVTMSSYTCQVLEGYNATAVSDEIDAYLADLARVRQPVANPRVAYQGEPGCYSEEATAGYFGPDVNSVGKPWFNDVFAALEQLHIPFERVEHEYANTMEDCKAVSAVLGVDVCKNLVLCNRQRTSFYLLLMPGDKPFKTKELSAQINSSRLSFGLMTAALQTRRIKRKRISAMAAAQSRPRSFSICTMMWRSISFSLSSRLSCERMSSSPSSVRSCALRARATDSASSSTNASTSASRVRSSFARSATGSVSADEKISRSPSVHVSCGPCDRRLFASRLPRAASRRGACGAGRGEHFL